MLQSSYVPSVDYKHQRILKCDTVSWLRILTDHKTVHERTYSKSSFRHIGLRVFSKSYIQGSYTQLSLKVCEFNSEGIQNP